MAEVKEVFEMSTKQIEPDQDSWKDQEQRQRRAGRRRKAGAIVVAAVIATVAVMVALRANDRTTPQPLDDPTQVEVVPQGELPTAIALNGIWLQVGNPDSSGVLVSFRPDGTFSFDDRGRLPVDPLASGTFTISDDEIAFTTVRTGRCGGAGWAWRASIPETGLMRAVYTAEGTGVCRTPAGTEWTLIRISPATAATDAMFGPGVIDTFPSQGPAPTPQELAGIWLAVDDLGSTSLLVRFQADGEFVMDDRGGIVGVPSVTGSFEIDRHMMAFSVLGGSACPADTFAWKANLAGDGLLHVRHIEIASTPDCLIEAGTEWMLIRVSPNSPASDQLFAEG